ncbi:MAG: acyl-CoA dehydrogenase family protein [Actinomycetota bacterium]|nr:acyl-CoA dehydrogenase family protein [Actinomycetota bacterium]
MTQAARQRPDTGSSAVYEAPWAFTDDHLQWQRTVADFCADVVADGAADRSINGRFDPDLVRAAGKLGVFGLLAPEPHGGGADLRTLCLATEELATVDSSLAVTLHVQAISVALFTHLARGRDELLAEVLPGAASGEDFISFGLTEPSGGSDAGNIATTARRAGDDWVINGSKQFITNSGTPFSRYVILFAATGSASNGHRAPVSAFLVPLDAPGVTVGPSYAKLGWRASDTHPLYFDDVRVPGDALLGVAGKGYRDALEFLTWARIPIAAMSLGLTRGCLADTRRFVDDRESFGKPLAGFQGVAFQIADIAAAVATCRVLTYDAAWKYDRGLPIEREAAIAKLVTSELANKAAYTATQLQGGYGFIQETDATRHYQDARILTIAEGTSEVQRLLIARGLGLPV